MESMRNRGLSVGVSLYSRAHGRHEKEPLIVDKQGVFVRGDIRKSGEIRAKI